MADQPEKSNLILHAERELALLGEDPDVVKGYLDMIQIFADMGHSGGSASVFIPTLEALLRFQPLTELNNDPDLWYPVELAGAAAWQSVRRPDAFTYDEDFKWYFTLGDHGAVSHDEFEKLLYTVSNPLHKTEEVAL